MSLLALFTSICGLLLAPSIHCILFSVICFLSCAFRSRCWCFRSAINTCVRSGYRWQLMNRTKRATIFLKVKSLALDALGLVLFYLLSLSLLLVLLSIILQPFFLFFSIFFYVFVYTIWLKKKKHLKILLYGGAAGAFPPVIGWACAFR